MGRLQIFFTEAEFTLVEEIDGRRILDGETI
ncbi:MAG: hypothetical protein J07AB43_05110 [Candidatus Nanosalina sp. J07AB43]|nr:MAG: hypothetical protein J07AB43_05110 [Candidatus Nanosalina sp. J07AB43]